MRYAPLVLTMLLATGTSSGPLAAQNVATAAPTAATSHSEPEVAAALLVQSKEIPTLRVVINSQLLSTDGGTMSKTDKMTENVAAALTDALNAPVVAKDEIRKCDAVNRCRFENTNAIITVSKAVLTNDAALVMVRLEVDERPGEVKGQTSREFEVRLVRQSGEWSTVSLTLTWIS